MEIQQHDGVVVDVAGCRQGFAELLRERERCSRGGGRRPRLLSSCPPSPPLYRPPGRGGAGQGSHLGWGRRPRGVPCSPRQVGRPPP